MNSRAVFFVVAVAFTIGCQSTAKPAPSTPAASAAFPDSVKWVQQAAEYSASVLQTYRAATARLEREAAARGRDTWAVILDADETVISNATYQAERGRQGLAYSTESWHAWVLRRESTPLPGARAFLARIRELGGRIAIVTNRLQSECADTAAVFATHSLVYDAMLCRQEGMPADKNPRFRAVADGTSPLGSTPREVLIFVGDNILDFPSLSQATRSQGDAAFAEFGQRYFMLPNPMYGSWQ